MDHKANATYAPVTNEVDVISFTYTGKASRPTSNTSTYSRKGSLVQKRVETIKPHRRPSYDFGDLQAQTYQEILAIYGQPGADPRNRDFFLTLAMMQKEHNNLKHLRLSKTDKAMLQKSFDEMKLLKQETNKILKESEKRTSPAPRRSSLIDKKLNALQSRKPKEDYFLPRPRSKEKLRLKPIPASKKVQLENDFYKRQRMTGDWRYNVHFEQRMLRRGGTYSRYLFVFSL